MSFSPHNCVPSWIWYTQSTPPNSFPKTNDSGSACDPVLCDMYESLHFGDMLPTDMRSMFPHIEVFRLLPKTRPVSNYSTSQELCTWYALGWVSILAKFIHTLQGYFTGTGAIIWRIYWQSWFNENESYNKPVCRFNGNYCVYQYKFHIRFTNNIISFIVYIGTNFHIFPLVSWFIWL